MNQNKKTDEEIDSKNKNIKSSLAEKQTMTKKEKEKEKYRIKTKSIKLWANNKRKTRYCSW